MLRAQTEYDLMMLFAQAVGEKLMHKYLDSKSVAVRALHQCFVLCGAVSGLEKPTYLPSIWTDEMRLL